MSPETGKPKYIIVLGTTYSGSGAVYDYLAGRGDLCDPLAGEEYQLPQVPNGLMALEAAAGQAFHPAAADHALIQFEDVVQRLARPRTRWRYGKDYARKIPGFRDVVGQFIDEVSTARIRMRLDWHRLMQSPAQTVLSHIKERFGLNQQPSTTRVLSTRSALVAASRSMHDEMFQPESKGIPVLLNQAGSGWNPVESTKYFNDRKVVLVVRDPRDQFAELKKFKKASDVVEFIKWYRALQKRIAVVEEGVVLKFSFEEFVANNSVFVESVCVHCGLDTTVSSPYQAILSEKNIGKYQRWLTPYEIEVIEDALIR